MSADRFRCFLVHQNSDAEIVPSIEHQSRAALPPGNVLIRVRYSSLNYKDAMAATGQRAIAKTLPHIPGIDAVGTVLGSADPRFPAGTEVIATGHELGVERWGGWSELLTCPSEWLVPLPAGLTAIDAMTLGTAGFTAAQCVQALVHQGITPDRGEVLVTGATGGVGSLSVMILSKLGYRVVAMTGKPEEHDWLKSIGASEVCGRDLLSEPKPRPLLSARFSGAIDTVGGAVLATVCKMISHRGCVACCGMAGGGDLALTVYPFILRGLTLAGIDSAWCPDDERRQLWNKLASEWKLPHLDAVRHLIPLDEVSTYVQKILRGENTGRVVIEL